MIPGQIINAYLSTQGETSDKFIVGPYRVEIISQIGGGHMIIWHEDEEEPDGTLDGCDCFTELEDMEEEYRQQLVGNLLQMAQSVLEDITKEMGQLRGVGL